MSDRTIPYINLNDFLNQNQTLPPVVVNGLLRRGEVANLIAAPKIGKTWAADALALCVASGKPWLGRFETTQGRALVIDNELPPAVLSQRMKTLVTAMGLDTARIGDAMAVLPQRGGETDIGALERQTANIEPGHFSLVVVDAFYRILPVDVSENENGPVAEIYGRLTRIATRLQSAIVVVHHSTKGNQSGKGITDVGSGAGSQSRAVDAHIILRPHQEEGTVVLEAAVRSFEPPDAICLHWDYPLWKVADNIDPTQLRCEWSARREARMKWTPERFAEEFVGNTPQTMDDIIAASSASVGSMRMAKSLLRRGEAAGLVVRSKPPGQRVAMFQAAA